MDTFCTLDLTLGEFYEDIRRKGIERLHQIAKRVRLRTPHRKTKRSPEGEGFYIPKLENNGGPLKIPFAHVAFAKEILVTTI
jgi:hypothetical protein